MANLFLLAQAANDVAQSAARTAGLARYAPLVVILLFFGAYVYWMRQLRKSQKPIQERSMEHIDRIEAKTEEMIALLQEIRDGLRKDE